MHKQLDEYLNTVAGRIGSLLSAQREDELREIRQHLELLVASHREDGRSEEEAIGLAISQFGRAEKIGRELSLADKKSRMKPTALSATIGCSVSMFIAYGFFSLINDKPTDFPYHQSDKLWLAAVIALCGFSIRYLLEKRQVKA